MTTAGHTRVQAGYLLVVFELSRTWEPGSQSGCRLGAAALGIIPPGPSGVTVSVRIGRMWGLEVVRCVYFTLPVLQV